MFGKTKKFSRRGGNSRALATAIGALILCFALKEGFESGPAPEPESRTGRVSRVHDGDTFTLVDSGGRETKVRLFGVDAPELDQAHGRESGQYLRAMLEGREVKVFSQGQDQYGRLLGIPYWPDDRSVTSELVAAGQVWVYEEFCVIDQCAWLRQAQKGAREARKGLWRDEKPMEPWKYRRARK